MLSAKDLMVSGAASCSPGEDLRVAAKRMRERDCGVLPVVDDSREVVGVLTDRDVAFAAVDQDEPLRSIPVERAMSRSVRALSTDADVEEIHGFTVLPPPIPRSVRVAEAPGRGRSVLEHAGRSKSAEAYRDLAEEIERRL